jgi:hypothetical protein
VIVIMENIGDEAQSFAGSVQKRVPKGLNPVAIELHDSLFSGGVRVSLK